MDILVIFQTALLYVIRGILEFLDKEGVRLTPGNISYVQNQVMEQLQGMDLMKNFSDQALIQSTIQGILLEKLVLLPEDIVRRHTWNGVGPKSQRSKLSEPFQYVVIHESLTDKPDQSLTVDEQCLKHMRELQQRQMKEKNKNDIVYNFVLCGDGSVYEGTGWDVDTDHAPELGHKSLGVSFLGGGATDPPSKVSLKLLDLLLQDGVDRGKLGPNYQVYSHSQLRDTQCPGSGLVKAVQTLPHWSSAKPATASLKMTPEVV